jgi:hypothetical protein
MNALITIDTFTIKQDAQGRYCLNDLHKASGGAAHHQPAKFFANQSTAELVVELKQSPISEIDPVQSIRGGSAPGTFVVKELVYAATLVAAGAALRNVDQRQLPAQGYPRLRYSPDSRGGRG